MIFDYNPVHNRVAVGFDVLMAVGLGNLNVLVTWQRLNEVAPIMWRLILLPVSNVPSLHCKRQL